MDLTAMSVTEIKALWLDQLLISENAQRNIQTIQQELKSRPVETRVDETSQS